METEIKMKIEGQVTISLAQLKKLEQNTEKLNRLEKEVSGLEIEYTEGYETFGHPRRYICGEAFVSGDDNFKMRVKLATIKKIVEA